MSMRWISLVALALWLPCAYGQDSDPEKLFREMEKKIRSAKSLHFAFEAEEKDTAGGKKVAETKGSFDLVDSKFRMEWEAKRGGETRNLLSVSDGKATYTTFTGKPTTLPRRSNDFDKTLLLLAHGGPHLLFSTSFLGPPEKFNDNFFKIKDIKLGAKEKVGPHDTQAVEYAGLIGNDKAPIKSSVWIDIKTNLPVKMVNVFRPMKNGPEVRQVVVYTSFAVDASVDPKLFELPK
jgi:hypothetical protein